MTVVAGQISAFDGSCCAIWHRLGSSGKVFVAFVVSSS